MNKSGAWLVRYALEQLGISHTFGIPGIANAEIYDQLCQSSKITPHLVNHEMSAAYMADATSRTSPDKVGIMVITTDAAITHSASGIGEALLAGVPMLVIAGSPDRKEEIDPEEILKPLTKARFKISGHEQIIDTLYKAHQIATSGKPGPVFVEISRNIQIASAEISEPLPRVQPVSEEQHNGLGSEIGTAANTLLQAQYPGILVGRTSADLQAELIAIAEQINAPVSTSLCGIGSFPARHPLHAGVAYMPSAENAFKECDCLLAIGISASQIIRVKTPESIIHINSYQPDPAGEQATQNLSGDLKQILTRLLYRLQEQQEKPVESGQLCDNIARDKAAFIDQWYSHNSRERVNPARFFDRLRNTINDETIVITDNGNHKFLTAELMPINQPRGFIAPTNYNATGYCVPAVDAVQLANPDKQVIGIVGDGAMLVSGMEALTAVREKLGVIFFIFNQGPLARTQYSNINWGAFADAIECGYFAIKNNDEIDTILRRAMETAAHGQPVFVDIAIDYSKPSHFAEQAEKGELAGFFGRDKLRLVSRAIVRKIIG